MEMMRLFIIALPTQKTTTRLLVEACQMLDLNYEVLNPAEVAPVDIEVKPGDMVYRVSDASHYGCLELEYDLIKRGAVSFYKQNDIFYLNTEEIDTFILNDKNVPLPKTIYYIPTDREALRRCVDYLGGFPICIKALGGSHGVGVMKVDSYGSLFSVADYIRQQKGRAVLKEFCDVTSTARLIVLGNRVIDSIEYSANKDDFRSNEGKVPNVMPKKFDTEIEEVAIKAVDELGLEFGGVDIMLTEDGPKIAEVNNPCFFARCQLLTGVNIAKQMVEYLIKKATEL